MTGGFTFNGTDISILGLEYVPDNQNTYVFRPSQWNMNEETFDAHDGGYYYGTTVKQKDFSLRCIYESRHVNDGILTRIFNTFKRGTTGRLVFRKRPWCWYVATVVSVDSSQMTNYMNGLITINMRAYYPFARTDKTYITDDDAAAELYPGGPTLEEDLLANTAMLKGIEWDLSKNFADTPITSQQTFHLYNPGTETAPVAIEIAGDTGTGIVITNSTTGQRCDIAPFDSTSGEHAGKYLIVDSLSGKVLLTDGSTSTTYGFLYHDNGYIDFASGYPVIRNVHVMGQSGQSQLTLSEPIGGKELIGHQLSMFVSGQSCLLGIAVVGIAKLSVGGTGSIFNAGITNVSDDGLTLSLDKSLASNVGTDAQIVKYNEITITPNTTMNLTKLIFRYRPTFT